MGLEPVVESIRREASAEAERIVAAARQERERMLSQVREQGEALVEERRRAAREQGERQRVQELARAELEARKIVLLAQKEILEEVRRRALEGLRALPDNDAHLRALLERHRAELDAGLVYCREGDAPLVRKLAGKRFGGTINCVGGLVIRREDGSYSLDLRYETLLADLWESAVRQVVEALWGG